MRKVFQAELHQVGEELIQIATLVQEALGSARLVRQHIDAALRDL